MKGLGRYPELIKFHRVIFSYYDVSGESGTIRLLATLKFKLATFTHGAYKVEQVYDYPIHVPSSIGQARFAL